MTPPIEIAEVTERAILAQLVQLNATVAQLANPFPHDVEVASANINTLISDIVAGQNAQTKILQAQSTVLQAIGNALQALELEWRTEFQASSAYRNQVLAELASLSSAVAKLVAALTPQPGLVMSFTAKPRSTEMAVVPMFSFTSAQDAAVLFQKTDGATPPVITDITNPTAVATLASDNPAVVSTDPVTGMTSMIHGLTAGTANVTGNVTYGDGSEGPYSEIVAVTCEAVPGQPGLVMTIGPAVARP